MSPVSSTGAWQEGGWTAMFDSKGLARENQYLAAFALDTLLTRSWLLSGGAEAVSCGGLQGFFES